jgi:hypothetical protein
MEIDKEVEALDSAFDLLFFAARESAKRFKRRIILPVAQPIS